MDNQLHVVWTAIVCVLAGLFGVLHIIAAASQIRKGYKPSYLVMIVGALLTIAAAVACLFGVGGGWNLDALLMALGGGAVCGAAWWNGRSSAVENGDAWMFHLSHHIIRFGFMLILVFTFARV